MRNRIYAADVSVFSDRQLFDAVYARMPLYRQRKIDRFRFDKDKYLSLGAGALLLKALENADILYSRVFVSENGRPDVGEDFFFNLSHSGELAVCAVSDRRVGIDTEIVRGFSDALARRVFSEKEIAFCRSFDDTDRVYTRMWTAKESIMKKTGEGLSLGAENISLDTEGDRPVSASLIGTGDRFFLHNMSYEEYELTVCSEYGYFAEIEFCELKKMM